MNILGHSQIRGAFITRGLEFMSEVPVRPEDIEVFAFQTWMKGEPVNDPSIPLDILNSRGFMNPPEYPGFPALEVVQEVYVDDAISPGLFIVMRDLSRPAWATQA